MQKAHQELTSATGVEQDMPYSHVSVHVYMGCKFICIYAEPCSG